MRAKQYDNLTLCLVKVQVKLCLCLTKNHAMKAYGEVEV
jgi:hypothetical protein